MQRQQRLEAEARVIERQAEQQRVEQTQLATLGSAARQLCDSGDHALAWQRYDDADARFPDRPALRQAREDCAMRWLREIHVESGKQTFTEIVNRVLPVLAQGAAAATGQRAGDLRAHMGWADFLRIREGAVRLDPPAHYRQALAADPANVYAHAMWGHHTMVRREPIAEAKQHFAAALASGREAAWVRGLQFSALLYYREPVGQVEAALAADDMRRRGEPRPDGLPERLWSDVYFDALLSRDRRAAFAAGLRESAAAAPASPARSAADPLATFQWLYPRPPSRDDRRSLWRYFTASLEELAGDHAAARQHFEALRDELKRERSTGRILDETLAGIKRLQAP
jgi:hypothetical protein